VLDADPGEAGWTPETPGGSPPGLADRGDAGDGRQAPVDTQVRSATWGPGDPSKTISPSAGRARSPSRGSAGSGAEARRVTYLVEYAPLLSLSARARTVRDVIEKVADTDATVLIRGESGVGKDLVARAIHAASRRHAGPWIKVNCAALPAELLETELFGHEKGAFTGAHTRKPGKFEFAARGTLCLDEVGEMPLGLQAKLLHVLQDRRFTQIGGSESIGADARVVAVTNRNLEAALAAGEFREDLYYRLNVVEILVPPLREQPEAIPKLVAHFLERFTREYRRAVEVTAEMLELFTASPWPGNVRELENAVRRLVVLGDDSHVLEELAIRVRAARAGAGVPSAARRSPERCPRPGTVDEGLKVIARRAARTAERAALLEVLGRVRWNRAQAARLLKVSYKTLLLKLVECGLDEGRSAKPPATLDGNGERDRPRQE